MWPHQQYKCVKCKGVKSTITESSRAVFSRILCHSVLTCTEVNFGGQILDRHWVGLYFCLELSGRLHLSYRFFVILILVAILAHPVLVDVQLLYYWMINWHIPFFLALICTCSCFVFGWRNTECLQVSFWTSKLSHKHKRCQNFLWGFTFFSTKNLMTLLFLSSPSLPWSYTLYTPPNYLFISSAGVQLTKFGPIFASFQKCLEKIFGRPEGCTWTPLATPMHTKRAICPSRCYPSAIHLNNLISVHKHVCVCSDDVISPMSTS